MKQTLGNKLLLILFLTIGVFANVTINLSSPAVYKGDMVSFTITAEGNDIEFPEINSVNGTPIMGTSSSQSISIINGHQSKTISKTYTFKATTPLTIPSFMVKVDGKEVKTKELPLKVVAPTASKNGQPFVLELALDKNESYVGEPINLTLTFKSKLNAHADKIQLGEPKLENFWVKKSNNVKKSSEGDYVLQSLHYKLFPQKAGVYTIPSIEALIGTVDQRRSQMGGFFDDPFFNQMTQQLRWKKIYSNSPKIKVSPLPNGLELYGNYGIEASVDRKKVQANKPVNLKIVVKGEGNIEDVKKFEPIIDNVIVYSDEPKMDSGEVNNIYQGKFEQKIALISDRNFTIPSLSLEYFDKQTKSLKTIQTKPIDIEVIGGVSVTNMTPSMEVSPTQKIAVPQIQKSNLTTKVITKTEDTYLKYLFLAIGFLLGVGVMWLLNKLKEKREPKKEPDIVKAIQKAKNDQELFKLLLPYSKQDKVITNSLNLLEENIYRNGENKIDKEALMEVFEG